LTDPYGHIKRRGEGTLFKNAKKINETEQFNDKKKAVDQA